jgi:hypothetical protein
MLKCQLPRLYEEFLDDYGRAEPLVEDVACINSIQLSPDTREKFYLNLLRESVAQQYCRLSIRNAVSSINGLSGKYLRRVQGLIRDGIPCCCPLRGAKNGMSTLEFNITFGKD